MPNRDAEWLAGRKFQVLEVARWFNLPPHMLKELERAIHHNVEHMGIEFVVYSLMPWLKDWEEEVDLKLLEDMTLPRQRLGRDGPQTPLYAKFNVDALLRGDFKARTAGYKIMREIGALSVNEIRALEEMAPIGPEGDVRLAPLNYTTLERLAANPPQPKNQRSVAPATGEKTKSREERTEVRSSRDRDPTTAQAVMGPLLREALARCVRKEANAIERACTKQLDAGDVEGFCTGLENFYEKHATQVAEAIAPVLASLGRLAGHDDEPAVIETHGRSFAQAYCRKARAALEESTDPRAVLRAWVEDGGVTDVAVEIERVWELLTEQGDTP